MSQPSDTAYHCVELNANRLIVLKGEDRIAFLNAQLCANVVVQSEVRLNAALSRQGRVLFLARLVTLPDQTLMILDDDADMHLTELQKFVLRRKVQLNKPNNGRLLGLIPCNQKASDKTKQHLREKPIYWLDDGRGIGWFEHQDTMASDLLSMHSAVMPSAWTEYSIDHGIPVLENRLSNQLLPFELNLDWHGAISFTKGCYPGQEIVSRMHFRDRIKKRMLRISLPQKNDASHQAYNRLYNDGCVYEKNSSIDIQPIISAAPKSLKMLASTPVSAFEQKSVTCFFADADLTIPLSVELLSPSKDCD